MKHLRLIVKTRRHPSAILLVVQLLGMLLYPFIENTAAAQVGFSVFGIVVLSVTTGMVRRTPGLTWVSLYAIPITAQARSLASWRCSSA